MNELGTTTDQILLELKASFNQAFSIPPRTALEAVESFIGVRVYGDPYALRVRDFGHLSARHKIVPLSGGSSDLLGLVGIRGTIVPVYSLARVLGYEATERLPQWLVASGDRSEMALAFEIFEGHFRVPATELSRINTNAPRVHIQELVASGSELRGVVDIESITKNIIRFAPKNDEI